MSWSDYLAGPAGRDRFRIERLRLPNGRTIGDAFDRDPWLREVWALKDAADLQVALIVGQRGIAKTTTAAAMGLEEIALGGESDVIIAANDSDQARLALDAAQGFLRRDPALGRVLESYRDSIRNRHTGSAMKIITSDAVTSFGLGIRRSLIIFDELWGLRDRDLLDSLLSALPKVAGSKLIALTNAGFVDSPAWSLLQICKEGDPAFRHWDSAERGVWPSWIDPAERDRQRRLLPPSVFARLWENAWTSSSGDFLTSEQVEACVDESLPLERSTFDPRRRYYLGVDLGLKHDRSVVLVGHRELERFVVDSVRTWYGSPERPVSLEDVTSCVATIGRAARIRRGLVDPWQGLHLIERLHRSGLRSIEEFPFTAQRIMMLSQSVWHTFRSGQIRIPPHAALIQELSRARVVEKRYGWRVDHESGGYSDHLIALGLALVASAGDAGQMVVDDRDFEHAIEWLQPRVREPRRFGLPRRLGLTYHSLEARPAEPGFEELHAELRLLQILDRTDRISSQERDSIAKDLRDDLRRQPVILAALRVGSDGIEDRLGRLSEFIDQSVFGSGELPRTQHHEETFSNA
jgi:hypothetical protein